MNTKDKTKSPFICYETPENYYVMVIDTKEVVMGFNKSDAAKAFLQWMKLWMDRAYNMSDVGVKESYSPEWHKLIDENVRVWTAAMGLKFNDLNKY